MPAHHLFKFTRDFSLIITSVTNGLESKPNNKSEMKEGVFSGIQTHKTTFIRASGLNGIHKKKEINSTENFFAIAVSPI